MVKAFDFDRKKKLCQWCVIETREKKVPAYFTFRMSRKEADIEIEHKKVLLNFKIFFNF